MTLCKGGDGLCPNQAEDDGYCDEHYSAISKRLRSTELPMHSIPGGQKRIECDLCRKDGADCTIAGRPAHETCAIGERRPGFLPVGVSWCATCRARLTLGYTCLWCREPEPGNSDLPSVYEIRFEQTPSDASTDLWHVQGPGIDSMVFDNYAEARVVERALNQAYGIGHAFGRSAGR